MSEMLEEERFDGLLLNFAQQCHGIDPLLDTVFSFLRRKTDFYQAPGNKARESVIRMFEKHEALAERTASEKKKVREEEEHRAAARRVAARKKSVQEVEKKKGADEAETKSTAVTAAEAPAPVPSKSDDGDDDDDEKEAPPPGNGGPTSWGMWTQQLSELQAQVPVPAETKSRDLIVDIQRKHLKVGLKGRPPIVDGELHKKIIVEDCFWTLEEDAAGRKEVVVSMQKENKMEWWKCVIVGDPEINTQKVQPENSKLSELDGETRMTVEKMMFDQRQKALGKPTADEMGKQEILEKFMKQHPEMDFSKAKFS